MTTADATVDGDCVIMVGVVKITSATCRSPEPDKKFETRRLFDILGESSVAPTWASRCCESSRVKGTFQFGSSRP